MFLPRDVQSQVIQTHLQLPGESAPRLVTLTSKQKNEVAPMMMSLLIDTSGSMAGSAISNVMDQSIKMLRAAQRLSHTTKVSVHHFDATVQPIIHCRPVKDVKFPVLKQRAEESAARGTRTALYDAIMVGLDNLKTYHKANTISDMHYFLTAFTDGMDNQSSHSLDDVCKALNHPGVPNFHFFVISAGLRDIEKAQLDRMVSGKRNCKHLPANSTSNKDLDKAFKEFTERMVESLTVRIVSKPGATPAMGKVMHGLQQMVLTGGGGGSVRICGSGGNSGVSISDVTERCEDGRGRSRSSSVDRRRGRSTSRSRR